MPTRIRHVVVIGASAGGIEALRTMVAALPRDFPAPVCVVVHTSPEGPGMLDGILARAGVLPATNARNHERLHPGHIYVAPPDFHLILEPGLLRVTKGPRENRFRPAIDPLFRSAAQVYGPQTIGVILTGGLDDGADGLWAVKRLGGTAIVQDPAEALFPSMPLSALKQVDADHVLPVAEIAPMLVALTAVTTELQASGPVPEIMQIEVKIAMEHNPIEAGLERVSTPSSFACPECHGVLLQITEQDGRKKFRCHTGHAYSIGSLLAAIDEGIEASLWNAIRALEEGPLFMSRVADYIKSSHETAYSDELVRRAGVAREQSEALRKLVSHRDPVPVSGKP